MRVLLIYVITSLPFLVVDQQTLTLEECYQLLKTNHPLAQLCGLLERQSKVYWDVINIGKLSQAHVAAQATFYLMLYKFQFHPLNN
jgi:hypothetical protein